MEQETSSMNQHLIKIERDIDLIKNILLSEGELTDWAKKELTKARNQKKEEYTNIDEL